MSDLFGNHIVGFPTRRLIYSSNIREEFFKNSSIKLLDSHRSFRNASCMVNFIDGMLKSYEQNFGQLSKKTD